MKLVESQFDKNDKSVEALTARNEVLEKSIEAQKEKIETLKGALNNASSSVGEADKRSILFLYVKLFDNLYKIVQFYQ